MSTIFEIKIETAEGYTTRDVEDIVHETLMDIPHPESVRLLSVQMEKTKTEFIPRDLEVE